MHRLNTFYFDMRGQQGTNSLEEVLLLIVFYKHAASHFKRKEQTHLHLGWSIFRILHNLLLRINLQIRTLCSHSVQSILSEFHLCAGKISTPELNDLMKERWNDTVNLCWQRLAHHPSPLNLSPCCVLNDEEKEDKQAGVDLQVYDLTSSSLYPASCPTATLKLVALELGGEDGGF